MKYKTQIYFRLNFSNPYFIYNDVMPDFQQFLNNTKHQKQPKFLCQSRSTKMDDLTPFSMNNLLIHG